MKSGKSFSMMLKTLFLTFSAILFYSLTAVSLKADLINPSTLIKPKEVIQIQLNGLMKNDIHFKDISKKDLFSYCDGFICKIKK